MGKEVRTMPSRATCRRRLARAVVAIAAALDGACCTPLRAAQAPPTELFDLAGLSKALQVGAALAGRGKWAGAESAPLQSRLLARLPESQADLGRIPELWSRADTKAEPLNRELARAGLGIRLQPWAEDGRHVG